MEKITQIGNELDNQFIQHTSLRSNSIQSQKDQSELKLTDFLMDGDSINVQQLSEIVKDQETQMEQMIALIQFDEKQVENQMKSIKIQTLQIENKMKFEQNYEQMEYQLVKDQNDQRMIELIKIKKFLRVNKIQLINEQIQNISAPQFKEKQIRKPIVKKNKPINVKESCYSLDSRNFLPQIHYGKIRENNYQKLQFFNPNDSILQMYNLDREQHNNILNKYDGSFKQVNYSPSTIRTSATFQNAQHNEKANLINKFHNISSTELSESIYSNKHQNLINNTQEIRSQSEFHQQTNQYAYAAQLFKVLQEKQKALGIKRNLGSSMPIHYNQQLNSPRGDNNFTRKKRFQDPILGRDHKDFEKFYSLEIKSFEQSKFYNNFMQEDKSPQKEKEKQEQLELDQQKQVRRELYSKFLMESIKNNEIVKQHIANEIRSDVFSSDYKSEINNRKMDSLYEPTNIKDYFQYSQYDEDKLSQNRSQKYNKRRDPNSLDKKFLGNYYLEQVKIDNNQKRLKRIRAQSANDVIQSQLQSSDITVQKSRKPKVFEQKTKPKLNSQIEQIINNKNYSELQQFYRLQSVNDFLEMKASMKLESQRIKQFSQKDYRAPNLEVLHKADNDYFETMKNQINILNRYILQKD